MDPAENIFSHRAPKWQKECRKLREVILDTGLTETVKWGWPCYMDGNANIVLIHAFKEYCAVLFFKGALLKDPENLLVAPGQTQAGRQMRFTSVEDVRKLESVLKAYIKEATAVENTGLEVKLKRTSDFRIPEEFKKKLDTDTALKKAFKALTPGRQRAYIFYFSQAKQSRTRSARIDKYLEKILSGKGMND